MYKIFLAWQSQNRATASFIKRQLDKVKEEFQKIGIEVEIIKIPTQDDTGSPDINEAIWRQIQSSDIFIADMSFVSDTIDMSNGNVMYETGIADAILGSNGLCLNALHDKAFDKGLITIDKNYCIVNSKQLKDAEMDDESRIWLQYYEGKQIILPDRFYPGKQFIEYHNDVIFKGV